MHSDECESILEEGHNTPTNNGEAPVITERFTQKELAAIYLKWNKRYRRNGLSASRKHFISRISTTSKQIKNLITVYESLSYQDLEDIDVSTRS